MYSYLPLSPFRPGLLPGTFSAISITYLSNPYLRDQYAWEQSHWWISKQWCLSATYAVSLDLSLCSFHTVSAPHRCIRRQRSEDSGATTTTTGRAKAPAALHGKVAVSNNNNGSYNHISNGWVRDITTSNCTCNLTRNKQWPETAKQRISSVFIPALSAYPPWPFP